MRSRLAVNSHKNTLDSIKTYDGFPFGREMLEVKVDDLKQYVLLLCSPMQESALKKAKTLYISFSYKQVLRPQWKDIMFIHCVIDGL